MRIYRGRREAGPPERARIFVEETVDGRTYELIERPYPLTEGVEWGYRGAGPYNAARSILDDLLGNIPDDAVVADFEQEVVAHLERSEFELTAPAIEAWLGLGRGL